MNINTMIAGGRDGAVIAGGVAAFAATGALTGTLAKNGRDIEPDALKVPAGVALYLGGAASITATAGSAAITGAALRDAARGSLPVGVGLAVAAAGAALTLAAPAAAYAAYQLS